MKRPLRFLFSVALLLLGANLCLPNSNKSLSRKKPRKSRKKKRSRPFPKKKLFTTSIP